MTRSMAHLWLWTLKAFMYFSFLFGLIVFLRYTGLRGFWVLGIGSLLTLMSMLAIREGE